MTDGLPNPQRLFAFIAIAIAIAMAVLDTAIVNVALPAIGHDLGVSPAQSIWVVNAYQLAITISLLPLASLGDIWGYKAVYWSGLAVFTVASLGCASAHTLPALACARVLQGLGAAGIMSVNIALVRFIYPRAQLGVGVGYASLIVAATSVAGPSIASAILAFAHWQWLFLVNVPLGALALLIGSRTLPMTPASGNLFDLRSAALNAVAFGSLIYGLTSLSQGGGWHAMVLLGVGAVVGGAFVWRESQLTVPMLPIDLLRLPVFALSLVTSICSFAAQTIAGIALPFYLVQVLGRSETQTGLLMTPWPLMTALVAPLAGRLSDRFAPQKLGSIGLVVLSSALASLTFLGSAPSVFDICWRLGMCGIGFGLFQSPNNRVIMGSAPRARSGGASGLQSMGRLLGQSFGAVAVTLAFSLAHNRYTPYLMASAAALGFIGACTSGLRRKVVSAL
ncbi:MAG: MFS transporter [Polyangiaceae bacterium]